jgi:hypothetical protein
MALLVAGIGGDCVLVDYDIADVYGASRSLVTLEDVQRDD